MTGSRSSATLDLARAVSRATAAEFPAPVLAEATRSLLNGLGTAIGAARYRELDMLVEAALDNETEVRQSRIPGRPERVDALAAAVIAGAAAHIDDFDDTHLATVTHPTAPVLAAALPLLHKLDVSGRRLVEALAVGMETEIRIAAAMTPWHYDAGWHITSTVGSIGASVTAAVLLDLDEQQLANAISIASSMVIGHREGFGTIAKSYHPGKAGANGLLAASMAAAGLAASPTALDGPYGYFACLSSTIELSRLTDGLGEEWQLLDNTYKPYPCGVVSHPAIEAAERLHGRLEGGDVMEVRVHCHPLVVDLAGNPEPATGLAGRFSAPHSVAAALVDGTAGLRQFEDTRVQAPDLVALRSRVSLLPDQAIGRDAATVEVDLADGRTLVESIAAVRGSLERPMTDAELDAKVTALVEQTMPGRGGKVVAAVRALPDAASLADLTVAVIPES